MDPKADEYPKKVLQNNKFREFFSFLKKGGEGSGEPPAVIN
jgi:hypothetical protein